MDTFSANIQLEIYENKNAFLLFPLEKHIDEIETDKELIWAARVLSNAIAHIIERVEKKWCFYNFVRNNWCRVCL